MKYWSALIIIFCALAANLSAAEPARWVAGITEPYLDVTLSAPVAGTITDHAFVEGDFVQKGKTILELDKRLEELDVTRAKLLADTLKIDLEGTQLLFDTTKSVSKEQLGKKEMEYKVAMVDYQTAVERLRKRQVAAPIDGYLVDLFFEVGEDCKAQDPVARLVDTRRCYFVSNIDATAGHGLQNGQKVNLEIETGAAKAVVQGEITFVSPVVDPASGLLKVKALFENPEGKIRPGVAGRMELKLLQDEP